MKDYCAHGLPTTVPCHDCDDHPLEPARSPESGSTASGGSENGAVGAAEAMAALLSDRVLIDAYRNAKAAAGDVARRAEATFLKEIEFRITGRSQNAGTHSLRAGDEQSQH